MRTVKPIIGLKLPLSDDGGSFNAVRNNLHHPKLSQPLPIPDEYLSFLRTTLLSVSTGQAQLLSPLLGTKARLGHKTGTSDQSPQGTWYGINDVGFVILPNNSHYTIAVLITDSVLSMEDSEKIIATISQAVFTADVGELDRIYFS